MYIKWKGQLKRHSESIHGKVTYSCDQCEHQTKYKAHLKTHNESIRGNVTYSCDQCEYM